jgi:tRNA(Ile)-lysidine synthase TilS/MesJ
MKNEIQLTPTYWASVSGGKDSLFMLNMILHNLDRYPLNGVVHFELEIDYPFIKKRYRLYAERMRKARYTVCEDKAAQVVE